jgi:hypothetical protein
MTEFSTLFFLIDDFKLASKETQVSILENEFFDPGFLNTLFKDLEYDPGDELVQKVLMKANL